MKIINVNCNKCGNTLKVNKNNKFVTCEYCNNNFYIDDEIKKVEIKIKGNNNDLENANTYLYNFKEYDKSLKLYLKLSNSNPNNKEIWIGILKSFTHDFTKTDYSISDKNFLGKTWNRFSSLASQEEINEYTDKMKCAFDIINEKIATRNIKKKKFKSWFIFIFFVFLIISCINITLFIIKPTKQLFKEIKTSDIINNCIDLDNCSMKNFVTKSISSKYAEISSIYIPNFSFDKKTYSAQVTFYNLFGEKTKNFDYSIVDDSGPVIIVKDCTIFENDIFDPNTCISAYDFTDGDIKINIEDVEMPESLKIGKNKVFVNVKDSEGNISNNVITLSVKQIPITKFDLNVAKPTINIGETTTYSLTIEPNVNNYHELSFDNSIISVSNNKITGLKKGKTNLCAISQYDNFSKDCVTINVQMICKNEYIFNFTGGKDETIYVGEDMCPGTYKVYAPSVLNYDDSYNIRKNGDYINSISIWKRSSYINDEGKKFILEDGDRVNIDNGILSVKLVKVK